MKPSLIDGIPVYEALVSDEDCGMVRISLVDSPAVLTNWLAFAADKRAQMYAVQNEEQRLVRGVVMRADFPIYRRDAADREYYVIYHADTIRQMAEKYLAESRQNNVDRNHDGNEIPGVQMVQYFIKDTAAGIAPEGFDEIADGSLFAEFHVTDDEVWAAIKAGIFMGFSLEGLFDFQPETSQEDVDAIVDELDRLGETFANETDNQSKQNIMSKIERTLARLRELLEADKPKTTEEPQEIKCGSVTTDKGPLSWDGEDDLEAGYNVYIIAEDGTRTPAPEGEYVTGDNKTIVVVDGKVAEIRDPEAEVAPQNEEEQTEEVTEEVAAEEQAPEAEAEPDYRALYEEAQARIAELEAQVAELMQANEDTLAAQATIEEELNASRQEVAALKATPAAKPAHEEVKAAAEAVKTGNKGIDRLASLMGR
jgi:molecular chaperone GrpE (heat shock protein)